MDDQGTRGKEQGIRADLVGLLKLGLPGTVEALEPDEHREACIAHFLACCREGRRATASRGEVLSWHLGRMLGRYVDTVQGVDRDVIAGVCALMQQINAGYESRLAALDRLYSEGGVR